MKTRIDEYTIEATRRRDCPYKVTVDFEDLPLYVVGWATSKGEAVRLTEIVDKRRMYRRLKAKAEETRKNG